MHSVLSWCIFTFMRFRGGKRWERFKVIIWNEKTSNEGGDQFLWEKGVLTRLIMLF